MLNRKVHPVIPCQGLVGASGDLAPLAHLAQVAIGEGEAIFQGRTVSGESAMREAKISALALEAKEGLALLNGTQGMLALLALGLRDAETAVDTADVATALSLDALRGSPAPYDERIARARPYPGHLITARNLERLTRGSEIRESHRSPERDPRVQDPYSPVAHHRRGAVRDALAQIRANFDELNSATDNPLVCRRRRQRRRWYQRKLSRAAAGDGGGSVGGGARDLSGIPERRRTTDESTGSQLPAFLVREVTELDL
jgi:histidine ammonia-lyase